MKSRNEKKDTFFEVVQENLLVIDPILAEMGISVTTRPLKAAIYFVEHCILDITGGTKKQYWNQQWFAVLFRHVQHWYTDFYGKSQDSTNQSLPGIIFIKNTPFRLNINYTRSEIEKRDKLLWLIFLSKVDDHDSLEDLIESPPNLNFFNAKYRTTLESQVYQIVASTRSLNIHLMTANLEGDNLQKFCKSILAHLENAINNAMKNNQEGRSLAMWELHLMIEKSIKLLIKQKKQDPPNSHDLTRLRKQADLIVDSALIENEFSQILSSSKAISFRYCEAGPVSVDEFFKLYLASLTISSFYAEKLHRSISFEDFRVLVSKPPWLDLKNT